jgi:5-methylcytosine-specific restriction enzyme subunit McrC
MILYAKTDEDVTPDNDGYSIGGNVISVNTLDMTQDFGLIKMQLDRVADTLMR